jgi:Family of unknown function (DUF6519)
MKADFSRVRFNRRRHYTSVLQQQGKVALDADANEQSAIIEYIRDIETGDFVGPYGGPSGDEGFEITVAHNQLLIGAGRYYVNGILCENEDPDLAYSDQPFLIHPSPTDGELLRDVSLGAISGIDIYLEVWRRVVTALDDPCLREPAIGQADTTARLQTVWRVIAEPVASNPEASPSLQDCCAKMYVSAVEVGAEGRLFAQTSDQPEDCSCQPTPPAGYRGIENQLYRVEIHQGGDEKSAKFKWSRENGSVVVGVTGVSGRQVYVDSLGLDANLGFSVGQWVEISDDGNLFGQTPNQPGDLYHIQAITPELLALTMTETVGAINPKRNGRLRRWDQFGPSANSTGVAVSGMWMDLENGIQIQFTPGQYQSGDYWLIPARTASGQIEWPPCDSDGAAFQPPRRTEVRRAPLACVQWDSQNGHAVVHDCRKSFPPLTALPSARAAIHVSTISWSNDDVMTLDHLAANGLAITFDTEITSPVNGANFIITFEVGPVAGEPTSPGRAVQSTILRQAIIIDSIIDGQYTKTLRWQLPYTPQNPAQREVISSLEKFLSLGAPTGLFARARVKLMGRAIFSDTNSGRLLLDGQAFSVSAIRADGNTPRIDLQLPSGNNDKASDFESWFYVAPQLMLISLKINYPDLTIVLDTSNNIIGVRPSSTESDGSKIVTPAATVTVSYPALADTTVTLALSGPTGFVSIQSSVIVIQGQTNASFLISILNNPGVEYINSTEHPITYTFMITASLSAALGPPQSQSASLTLTGVASVIL